MFGPLYEKNFSLVTADSKVMQGFKAKAVKVKTTNKLFFNIASNIIIIMSNVYFLGRRPMAIFGSWTVTGCLTIICVSQIILENGVGNAQIAQIFVIIGVISHVVVKASSIAGIA